MYEELVKELRGEYGYDSRVSIRVMKAAADAIEKLSAKVDSLQLYADNISKLPDCNTCLKNGTCEFRPKLGEYCRINCHAWAERPPKGANSDA